MKPLSSIPYGRQSLTDADIEAVSDVLRSDFLTQGPAVPIFESAVASYCQIDHAVAANSATSALHIACLALGLGPGDVLWTSPITFVASANCALYCGAAVDFVDIDPLTRNLCPVALEAKLRTAKTEGKLPKIVVPVHFTGLPCDMEAIYSLSKVYGFRIIEDASHAIGARLNGEPVGNCRYSDVTVFSFHPVKIITTGEGGIATTRDTKLAEQMRRFRSHGIVREVSEMSSCDGPWYYEQQALGYNYRMTDMQAALGASQMKQLENFIRKREHLAERYDQALKDLACIRPARLMGYESAWHLYVIEWDEEKNASSRKALFNAMKKTGIGVNVHYIPIYRQPYYAKLGDRRAEFPHSERYYERAITLPLFPALTIEDQDHVVEVLYREARS
jgi:UDP-4-amino-4,6-dideoxy-N-acetyl-beta-L-altrosamine transaminase